MGRLCHAACFVVPSHLCNGLGLLTLQVLARFTLSLPAKAYRHNRAGLVSALPMGLYDFRLSWKFLHSRAFLQRVVTILKFEIMWVPTKVYPPRPTLRGL